MNSFNFRTHNQQGLDEFSNGIEKTKHEWMIFCILYTLDIVKCLKELWDKIQFLQTAFTFEHLFPKLQKTHISIDKFSFCYYLDLFMNSFNFRTHNQQELDGFLKGIGKTYHKDFVFVFYTLDRVKGLKELWDKIQFLQTAFTFEHPFPKLQKTHFL